MFFFFFKQKTAYEIPKRDWSSDVCSSDLTPFFSGYRPQFYFRTTDVTGDMKLAAGVEMVMPGDNVSCEVTLITPVALEKGLRFAIREGGHTVGAGAVTEIIE